MILSFDPRRMNVQVICGSLEAYKPSDNVVEIQKLVDTLREKMEKFQTEVVGPELAEIQKRVDAENKRSQSKDE